MHGLRVPVFAGRVWEAMHAGVRPGLSDPLFVKGLDLVQEPNSMTSGQKRANHIFPNLSAVAKSYEPIFSNLLNGNVPQSQL